MGGAVAMPLPCGAEFSCDAEQAVRTPTIAMPAIAKVNHLHATRFMIITLPLPVRPDNQRRIKRYPRQISPRRVRPSNAV
jgi:hypothetical protein